MGDPDASDESERDDGSETDRQAERDRPGSASPPREAERGDDAEHAESDAESDRYGVGFTPDDDSDPGSEGAEDTDADAPDDHESLREELDRLRENVDEFEEQIENRTVHREEIEEDLRAYVRARVRRGHARGWGPYLVLLYGTAMTIGAFVELSGVWAVLAMIVIWLSTLGLYTLMILFGLGMAVLSAPGRGLGAVRGLIDTLRNVRS
jgi:hypothetical protein